MANTNAPFSRHTDFPYCPEGQEGPGQQTTGILTKLHVTPVFRPDSSLSPRHLISTPKELIASLNSYENTFPNMNRYQVYFTSHNISDTLFSTLLLLLSSINILS
jgi:hypothetical protein